MLCLDQTLMDGIDNFGYFTDLTNERVEYEGQPFPHILLGAVVTIDFLGKNQMVRCDHYWSYKECPNCNEKNGHCGKTLRIV